MLFKSDTFVAVASFVIVDAASGVAVVANIVIVTLVVTLVVVIAAAAVIADEIVASATAVVVFTVSVTAAGFDGLAERYYFSRYLAVNSFFSKHFNQYKTAFKSISKIILINLLVYFYINNTIAMIAFDFDKKKNEFTKLFFIKEN
jgi:hypothetical protein